MWTDYSVPRVLKNGKSVGLEEGDGRCNRIFEWYPSSWKYSTFQNWRGGGISIDLRVLIQQTTAAGNLPELLVRVVFSKYRLQRFLCQPSAPSATMAGHRISLDTAAATVNLRSASIVKAHLHQPLVVGTDELRLVVWSRGHDCVSLCGCLFAVLALSIPEVDTFWSGRLTLLKEAVVCISWRC